VRKTAGKTRFRSPPLGVATASATRSQDHFRGQTAQAAQTQALTDWPATARNTIARSRLRARSSANVVSGPTVVSGPVECVHPHLLECLDTSSRVLTHSF